MRLLEIYRELYARKHIYFTKMRFQFLKVVARGPGLLRSYKTAAFQLCNRHPSVLCTKDLGLGKIRMDRYQRTYAGKCYQASLMSGKNITQNFQSSNANANATMYFVQASFE